MVVWGFELIGVFEMISFAKLIELRYRWTGFMHLLYSINCKNVYAKMWIMEIPIFEEHIEWKA